MPLQIEISTIVMTSDGPEGYNIIFDPSTLQVINITLDSIGPYGLFCRFPTEIINELLDKGVFHPTEEKFWRDSLASQAGKRNTENPPEWQKFLQKNCTIHFTEGEYIQSGKFKLLFRGLGDYWRLSDPPLRLKGKLEQRGDHAVISFAFSG
jgi:hypothetical protein